MSLVTEHLATVVRCVRVLRRFYDDAYCEVEFDADAVASAKIALSTWGETFDPLYAMLPHHSTVVSTLRELAYRPLCCLVEDVELGRSLYDFGSLDLARAALVTADHALETLHAHLSRRTAKTTMPAPLSGVA